MRKSFLLKLLIYSGMAVFALQSCKDDSFLTGAPSVPDQSFVEEFDTLSAAIGKGWRPLNRSEPIGRTNWFQGNSAFAQAPILPYSSKATNIGFVTSDAGAASILAGQYKADISNWLVSPSVTLQNGDKIIFYTRETDTISRWADRLQVCINKYDDDFTSVGRGASDAGKFNTVILDINPYYASGFTVGVPLVSPFDPRIPFRPNNAFAYPRQWTRFEATISGLNKPVLGRFAFRHLVELGGITETGATLTVGARGDAVSIDSVAFVSVSRKKI